VGCIVFQSPCELWLVSCPAVMEGGRVFALAPVWTTEAEGHMRTLLAAERAMQEMLLVLCPYRVANQALLLEAWER
jgi:hypothetical protein